ncbi:MAG: response regulator [Thermodesulfobacteriota bacterium]
MRLLIVDDSSAIRLLLQRFLSPFAECATAGSGDEALELFAAALDTTPFDAVLTDLNMPLMDGHQLLAALRRLEEERGAPPGRRFKAAAVTSFDDNEEQQRCREQDKVDAFVVKPFTEQSLVAALAGAGILPPGSAA